MERLNRPVDREKRGFTGRWKVWETVRCERAWSGRGCRGWVGACLRYGCVCCENGWEWMPSQGGVGQFSSSLFTSIHVCVSSLVSPLSPPAPHSSALLHGVYMHIHTRAKPWSTPALVLLLATERRFKLRIVWKSVVRMIKDSRLLWTCHHWLFLPLTKSVRSNALIGQLPNELDRSDNDFVAALAVYLAKFLFILASEPRKQDTRFSSRIFAADAVPRVRSTIAGRESGSNKNAHTDRRRKVFRFDFPLHRIPSVVAEGKSWLEDVCCSRQRVYQLRMNQFLPRSKHLSRGLTGLKALLDSLYFRHDPLPDRCTAAAFNRAPPDYRDSRSSIDRKILSLSSFVFGKKNLPANPWIRIFRNITKLVCSSA